MSKFDDLCQTYRNSRRAFVDYQRACQDFARDLIMGMVDYFEWPRNQEITYIALGDDDNKELDDRFYALASAMRLDDQSFWHFGVELTIHEGNGSHPIAFVISFFIKKVGAHFVVKLGPKGREIKIPENQPDLTPFYDAIFANIVEFFNKRYHQAVANPEKKTFGFITLVEKTS